jgi:hypothetical protein
MVIMCIPLVESLCQTWMGWIPALEYILSGMYGLLWPRPIVTGTKCHRFLRPRCWECLSAVESPPGGLIGHPGPSRVEEGGGTGR